MQYFAALTPVIEKDYASAKDVEQALSSVDPNDVSTWLAFTKRLRPSLAILKDVLADYRAIEPPPSFRSAHARPLKINQVALRGSKAMPPASNRRSLSRSGFRRSE